MNAPFAGAADVVEIDRRRDPQELHRFLHAPGARVEGAWMPGERELPCAVRGP